MRRWRGPGVGAGRPPPGRAGVLELRESRKTFGQRVGLISLDEVLTSPSGVGASWVKGFDLLPPGG